jgi:A/G-specific adenine glycosylase
MADWALLGSVEHSFTHFSLTLAVHAGVNAVLPQGDGEWWPLGRLEQAGLPTLFAKAARLALAVR